MQQIPKERIFITYEDVIKTFKPTILKMLLQPEYRQYYEEYIDYSKFENKTYEDLLRFCASSRYENILQFVAKKEFDYHVTYRDLLNQCGDLFTKSQTLLMGQNLIILLKQSFVEKVYLYTPTYDERIKNDVSFIYKDTDKLEYISGDFQEAVNSIDGKITSYILNDMYYVLDLININKASYKSILLLDIGYNYIFDDDINNISFKVKNLDELSKEKVFKIGFFGQFELPKNKKV